MLKKTVTYTDIDEKPVTKDLYFNLRKSDVLGELALIDRFEKFKAIVDEEPRELTTPEKQEMVDLIKAFARLAYGVRTETGGHRKTEEIWQDFLDSEAWDIFFWELFENPEAFQRWMTGVLPQDLRDEARKQIEEMKGQEALPFGESNVTPSAPPVEKPLDQLTPDELRARLAELEGK